MKRFLDVTIDCDRDTAALYEHKFQDPLSFPITGCTVTNLGGRTTIYIPPAKTAGEPEPMRVLDRLIDSGEPEQAGRSQSDYTLSGRSEHLVIHNNIEIADSTVTFKMKMTKASVADGAVA